MKAIFLSSCLVFPALCQGADTILADLSAQSLPRPSETECKQAGKTLNDKLQKKSFTKIKIGCLSISGDVGGFAPTVQAKNAKPYAFEQGIGPRRPNLDACKKDLSQLKGGVTDETLLEGECLKGTEYDNDDKSKEFYQAWITKLVELKDKPESIESKK